MPPTEASRARAEGLAWVLATLLLQAAMLLDAGFLERDPEELFSAGQAWLALNGDLPWLLHMQYRPFCGGCTVHAVTAMGLFSALPPTWLVWKIIPLLWGASGMGIGFAIARREGGAAASRMFGLLWLLPPLAFSHLSLVAWGNHFEAGVLALAAAGLALGRGGAGRRLALGVLLGFSVYVSFSAGFAVLACLAFVAWRERLRGVLPMLLGLPLGLLGWAAQWALAGQHPFHTIYEAGESVPDPLRVPAELWTLLSPRQLAALMGAPVEGLGQGLGLAGAVALLLAAGFAAWRGGGLARMGALLLGAFLLVYGLTGFSVKVAEAGFMYPGGLRYAAPMFPAAALLLAGVGGGLWRAGRRLPAVLLLVPWLGAGTWARWDVLGDLSPAPGRLQRDAVDWEYLRERLAWMVPEEGHRAGASAADPHTLAVHAYGLAREATTARMRGAEPGGVPEGCAAGHGAGDALAQERGAQSVAEQLDGIGALALSVTAEVCAAERVGVAAIARGADPVSWVGASGGLARAAGEAWALGHAGPTPGPLLLPDGAGADFVLGVGLGLGRRWGPAAAGHPPDGLPPGLARAHADGVALGVARDWSLGRAPTGP